MFYRAILRSIDANLFALKNEVRALRQDANKRNVKMARSFDEVLEKIRAAKSVSESTNIGVKEAIRLLKASQIDPADPAKMDEAIELLDAMAADDAAVLVENTPVEEVPAEEVPVEEPPFTPSGN